MGVTVGVLVLLMFTIQGMGLFDRLLQRRQAASALLDAPSTSAPAAISDAPRGDATRDATPGGEIVAAIAAALALAEDESQVRQVLNNPPSETFLKAGAQSGGAWAQAGRRRLMDQRGRPSR